MSFDLGMALTGALGGLGQGLQYIGKQQDAEAERAQAEADNEAAWEARQKWLQANEAPKTATETVADPNNPGQNIIRNKHWEPASGGEPAQWLYDSQANDPATERIASTAETAAERLKQQGETNEQRLEIARQRLELQQEKGSGQGKLIRQVDADGNAVYGTVKDGVFSPIQDEQGNPVSSRAWRARQGVTNSMTLESGDKLKYKSPDAIGPAAPADPYQDRPDIAEIPDSKASPQVTFVDPSKGKPAGALSQLSSTQSSPSQPNAPSIQDLMQQASAAVAKGAPRDQVEARLKQLMQQYGYNPQ